MKAKTNPDVVSEPHSTANTELIPTRLRLLPDWAADGDSLGQLAWLAMGEKA
jgi:hypothetical protein